MAYQYELRDYINIYNTYVTEGMLAAAAARQYQIDYPNRGRPCARTFTEVASRLQQTGQLMPPITRERAQPVRDLVHDMIFNWFQEHPGGSIREAVGIFGVNFRTIWQILDEEGLYPYHFTKVQHLQVVDHGARLHLCQGLIDVFDRFGINISEIFLWSDESISDRKGLFNIHNYHTWSEENPYLTWDSNFQTKWSVHI
ncbi:hypothetical protein QAD02_021917 [Eretmocerus hayati]|uniref:Uncharacterized protein n=1 Tax=Eretmocerus hayati TaxID=131215 RepID=A0ACC2PRK6_9HYME|nr:hypothetical protein QAD02_021917 [Eretmocerus hayati]